MKNEMMVFEGSNVEVFEFEGKVLFNSKDVGKCLGMEDSTVRKAINSMSEKQVMKLTNSIVKDFHFRKLHNTGENFLTESGVYKLVMRSNKPEAERFQEWVVDDVLPSIRKYGIYAKDDLLNDPDALFEVVSRYREERHARVLAEKTIEEQKPKVLFAEAVNASHTSILVGDLAKLIKQNGYDIGANRLFEWLRENDYLIKRKGTDYNTPTQKSMNLGLFEVKESVVTHHDGHTTISKTSKVTGKGQIYFINKFLAKEV